VTISDNWLGGRARALRASSSSVFDGLANLFGDSIDITIMDICRLYLSLPSPNTRERRLISVMSFSYISFSLFVCCFFLYIYSLRKKEIYISRDICTSAINLE